MLVRRVTRRQLRAFGPYGEGEGEEPPTENAQVNVKLTESTALKGVGVLVAAGVLTHIAVRLVDSFFKPRR